MRVSINDFLTAEQVVKVMEALHDECSIIISGNVGSGKTALFKWVTYELVDLFDDSVYKCVDEVTTESDINAINEHLAKGQAVIFTTHIYEEETFRRLFQNYDGLWLNIRNVNGKREVVFKDLAIEGI